MITRADFAVGIILMMVGALMIEAARHLPMGDDPLGPRFMPMFIGVALIGLSLLLAVKSYRAPRFGESGSGEECDRVGASRVVAAAATMTGFVLALVYLPWIGFPVLGTFAVFILTLLFGGRFGLKTLAFSIALCLGVYFLFRIWFQVPLPDAMWR